MSRASFFPVSQLADGMSSSGRRPVHRDIRYGGARDEATSPQPAAVTTSTEADR